MKLFLSQVESGHLQVSIQQDGCNSNGGMVTFIEDTDDLDEAVVTELLEGRCSNSVYHLSAAQDWRLAPFLRIKEIVRLSDRLRELNIDITLNPAYLDKVWYLREASQLCVLFAVLPQKKKFATCCRLIDTSRRGQCLGTRNYLVKVFCGRGYSNFIAIFLLWRVLGSWGIKQVAL